MLNLKQNKQRLIEGVILENAVALALFLFIGFGLSGISQADDNKSINAAPPIEAGFIGNNSIYLTEKGQPPIKNELVIYIRSISYSPTGEPRTVPAAEKSYIKIYFDYGDGLGDLSKKITASSFNLDFLRLYDNKLDLIKSGAGYNVFWSLAAKSGVFLQGRSNNRIELKFSDIYSYLQPGLATLYIEYGNIPGYQDGRLSLPMVKEKPGIMQLKYGVNVGGISVVEKDRKLEINGTVKLQKGGFVNKFTDDVTLSENSNLNVATEKAVKTYVDNRLPGGVIVMWSGKIQTIPQGWVLCDGNNGTPNLSDSFVLGYGKKELHATGGAESVELTVAQMPQHSHTGETSFKVNEPVFATERIFSNWPSANRKYANKTNPVNVKPVLNLKPTGNGQPHDNMPPFYVLAYIMKI